MQGLLGIIAFIAIAWILSENRRQFRFRLVFSALAAQVATVLLIKIDFVYSLLSGLNTVVVQVTQATQQGTSFVFGYIGGGPAPFAVVSPGNTMVIAFQILPIILVMSALSAVLYHYGILQRVILGFSWLLKRTTGVSGATGLGVASSIFLGIIESPLFVRPYLANMSRSSLFTLITAGMSTVAGTVVALYASFLEGVVDQPAAQIMIASVMSAPAAILFAKIMIPSDEVEDEISIQLESETKSPFEAIINGTRDGIEMCVNIAAILVVLFAFIYLINNALSLLSSELTLQSIAARIFYPLCWLMGIPGPDLASAAKLMGIKTILNEFVAYSQINNYDLAPKSRLILSYAMCGFANFGSLGILIGGLGPMIPQRKQELVGLCLKSIISGTLATMTTGALIGLIGL